jgi:phospholipid/cholesterol/gamma-HCH transport system substrate-binding protein
MNKESLNRGKLGMFVVVGILLFIVIIYVIGINRNLFGSNFILNSQFKNVSGLKVGSNVRLSGINIGTVSKIEFITDSLVLVRLLIKDEVQQYIKIDALASIGSDGLVGDKVLIIEPGSYSKSVVKDNGIIASNSTIEIEDVMKSIKKSAENAEIITNELADFSFKMNDKNGFLSKVMTDKKFALSMEKTIGNLEISTNEIAKFSPKINDQNGVINRLFVDKNFSNKIDKTITNLEKSTSDLSIFTSKINTENSTLTKLITDPNFAKSISNTFRNLEISTNDFVKFTSKINNDSNVLSKLIDNKRLGNSVDSTITKIGVGAEGIIEIENAVKSNFLLRGYFNRKKRNEEKNKK